MINPKDLRIDNIIKVREDGKWRTASVSSVFPSWITASNPYINLSGTFDANELHGAYLSDDWLVDNCWNPVRTTSRGELFVFEEADPRGNNIYIEMYENGYFSLIINNIQIGKEFRCIHELQNLFFSVVGKELLNMINSKITLSMAVPLSEKRNANANQ